MKTSFYFSCQLTFTRDAMSNIEQVIYSLIILKTRNNYYSNCCPLKTLKIRSILN